MGLGRTTPFPHSAENGDLPRRWLITGGCGFIGTNLIAYLLRRHPQTRIRVMDNLSVGRARDLARISPYRKLSRDAIGERSWEDCKAKVDLVRADIRDAEACEASCRGAEAVIHLAANTGVGPSVEDPRTDMEINVTGLFNMLEGARKASCQRFLLASSGASVGAVEPPIHEGLAPRPVSPYGASKLAGEGYCSAYYQSFGIKTVSLRFGNVYGPGSAKKQSVVAKFIRRALEGKPLEIYGDGGQTRDFIYIDDLVDAIIRSVCSGAGGELYQIATSKETTVNEIAERVKAVTERCVPELTVQIVHQTPRLGDLKRNVSDIGKAQKELGWTCQHSLETGIAQTVRWFLDLDRIASQKEH